jgi:two-component system LytT family response regulator
MNDILKILVVDDEQPARKKIISFLSSITKEVEILEASNGKEAVEKITKLEPDLVLLDIQMPGLTGFEVIEKIRTNKMPTVIFITAYDQFAIEAFEVNAIDYLLKPFDRGRFTKSFNRAVEYIKTKHSFSNEINNLPKELKNEKKYLERIMVNVGSRYIFINTTDIIYISSNEKYVEIHTESKKYLLREAMKNIEKSLDPKLFTRIHRSYIVNINEIKEMQHWSHGDYIVILKNGQKITMSRRYKERLIK